MGNPPKNAHTDPLALAAKAVGDQYQIESLAGQGGSGRVFSATRSQTGERVAIKLLTISHPSEPQAKPHTKLAAEARAMANLDHPDLCRVVEVSLKGSTPYLAMEWADGEPLNQFARRKTIRARITLILRVIDATAQMHQQGLIHGDLKPANILVDRDGKPTIVDFGLARAESDPSSLQTQQGGSPGYAAPEQLVPAGDTPIGPEADVFALGVMLYELLTERPPLPRSIAPSVFVDLLNRGAVRLPDEIAPDTPADLQKICLAAIEPEPERRYRDAGALAVDIRRYLSREAVAARPRLLADRLSQQVEKQIAQTAEWQRLGMITRRDAEVTARVLRGLPHAEPPWIIDTRRLRASQIAISLGGWLVALAIAIGFTKASPLPAPIFPALAAIASALLLFAGLHLLKTRRKRLALGMLATAQIAVPAAVLSFLNTTGWHITTTTNTTGFLTLISNELIFTVSLSALLTAAILRFITRQTIFSITLPITTTATWASSFLLVARDPASQTLLPRFALCLIAIATLMLVAGHLLHASQLKKTNRANRQRPNDAAPLLTVALLTLAASLSLLATTAPGWYIGRPNTPPNPAIIAYAFLANALLLTAAVIPLIRTDSKLARRTISAARWLLPTHLMLPLVFMEVHHAAGVTTPWLVLLLIASLGFIAASALQQWRPFLLPGLAFLAVWFERTSESLSPPASAGLAIATLTLGLALMFLAWRAPAYLANRRLKKWTRAADARPDPQANRSWR